MRSCNKWNAVPLCCVKYGVMHNVANIRRDLKCRVEYMECCVMWNVMRNRMQCDTDVVRCIMWPISVVLQSGIVCCERCWCDI